jgi:peptide/nickel transport system substrate-binding protein
MNRITFPCRPPVPQSRNDFPRFVTCFLAMFALSLALVWPAGARESIRIGLQLEPPMLDPTVTASATAGEIVYGNVFEGLTILDGEGKIAPRLALSWEQDADGLRYDFTLREDVWFHDGQPFNAEVATFSLNRIITEDSTNPQRQWFERVSRIESLGPTRLRIHLAEPDAFLPFALALPAAVIVHPDSASTNRDHPVGTGPFRFAVWTRGQNLVLERTDAHWGKRPALRQAEYVFMHTRPQVETMLSEGLVDVMLDAVEMSDRFVMRPDYRLVLRNLDSQVIVAMNNARPPLTDIRVRRAISHAVNRDELLGVYGRTASPLPIGTHFSPGHPAYVDLTDRYPYDPEQARALLTEAGVTPGAPLRVIVPPTLYGRTCGLEIVEYLDAVGFATDYEEYPWHRWLSEVFQNKDFDLTVIAHVEPLDLNIYARDDYYFNYDNTAFQALWREVLDARGEEELHRLLGEAQRRITEDAVNVFLFLLPHKNIVNRRVGGMWENTPIPSFVLEDLYWSPPGSTD